MMLIFFLKHRGTEKQSFTESFRDNSWNLKIFSVKLCFSVPLCFKKGSLLTSNCSSTKPFLLCALILTLGGCRRKPETPVAVVAPKPVPTSKPKPPKRVVKPRPCAQIVYSVSTKHRVYALTFDDGPDPTWTPQVLKILRQKRVKATFFMVGQMLRAYPKHAKQVRAEKHAIGNHSWSHNGSPKSPVDEVARTDILLKRVCGSTAPLFRPPYGLMKNGMVAEARKRGEDIIIWSAVGADWDAHASADSIRRKIVTRATPGGIALLHDGGGNRRATVAALPRIIDELKKRGYRFVTVPELLKMGPVVSHAKPIHKIAARSR